MRIGQHAFAGFLIRHVLAPDLPKCQKKALGRSVSIDEFHRRLANDVGQRHVSQFQASIVGGIFTQRQPAIELHLTLVVLHRDKARILLGGAIDALLKFLAVLRRPPVAEVALRIVLAPLVVEAMREFMPDHHPDAAIVHGVIHQGAVKRRLQNARGKVDIVHRRTVIGIDRRRSHAPILAVRGPVDLLVQTLHLEPAGAHRIARVIVGLDRHAAVIAPRVGIANVVDDGAQLLIGLLLRRVRHPRQLREILMHCVFDGLHQLQGALFAFGAERAIYIELAQRHAQIGVGGLHAALPARLHLFLSRHVLAVELEILFNEGIRQDWSVLVDRLPAQIYLPVFERHCVELVVDLLEEIGIAHVERSELGRSIIGKVDGEVEIRGCGSDFRDGHLMVARFGIAAKSTVH